MSEKQAKQQDEAAAVDRVAPVESVETAPVRDDRPDRLKTCWNCRSALDLQGICAKCGFDVNQLHNVFLETDKRQYQERQERAAGN